MVQLIASLASSPVLRSKKRIPSIQWFIVEILEATFSVAKGHPHTPRWASTYNYSEDYRLIVSSHGEHCLHRRSIITSKTGHLEEI